MAALRAMLPALSGKRVVDFGCGYGWFCRFARDEGAASVTGLDVSNKMLEKARQMTPDGEIVWQYADLESLTLPAEAVDLVYSSLALHYLTDLDSLFHTVFQALTPGGMMVFSAEHPIYTAPMRQGWLRDADGRQSWPVNNYQQEGVRISNWFTDGVRKQHRKLATWITALINSGFELVQIDEWGPDAAQITANPALAEEAERPMLFLLAARKPTA